MQTLALAALRRRNEAARRAVGGDARAVVRHGGAGAGATVARGAPTVGKQLVGWRSELFKSLSVAGFRASSFGRYRAPETQAQWFNCWASTNADATPKPRASVNSTECGSDTSVFVASDLNIGAIWASQHKLVQEIVRTPAW